MDDWRSSRLWIVVATILFIPACLLLVCLLSIQMLVQQWVAWRGRRSGKSPAEQQRELLVTLREKTCVRIPPIVVPTLEEKSESRLANIEFNEPFLSSDWE